MKGESKLRSEQKSNISMHIKNNIKYFLDTHFGNLMNEKDDPMTKGVALQGDQLQK